MHPSAWRDCLKRGLWVVVWYSSMHEKPLPNRSFQCRMELYRTSLARPQRVWATEDPQSPRDPRRCLLRLEKRLPVPEPHEHTRTTAPACKTSSQATVIIARGR